MTRTNAGLTRLAGGLIAGAVVLTGCSGDGSMESMDMGGNDSGSSASESSADDSAAFNDADVTFVQEMIPHHRGALAMAQLADGRAEDERVLALAGRIEAAQEPEIEMMTGWLEEWGEPVPDESDMGMGGMEGMEDGGMEMGGMSEEDMSALEAASGAEFDRMFLETMIEHHSSAVEMAETQIAEGSNPDAVALAEDIAESQTAEIEEMRALLSELGG